MQIPDSYVSKPIMTIPKIFFETSIWKYSFDRVPRLLPNRAKIEWGGKDVEFDAFCFFTYLPNAKLDVKMKKEIMLLRPIAELARNEKIELMTSIEVFEEYWNIPGSFGSGPSCFDNVPITHVAPPFNYSRTVGGKKVLISFLKRVNIERFKELQVACGAYQGKNGINENQLLDAYHIYSAESAKVDYFLTGDKKLIRVLKHHKKYSPSVKIVLPSTLMTELEVKGIR